MSTSGTIAAIATAIVPAQGSVGIVRLSGLKRWRSPAFSFTRQVIKSGQAIAFSTAMCGIPGTDQVVDEALLLLMLAPRSYTREDVVEFHCHGGIMAVQQVLQLCLEQGAQLAQPENLR
jgi:tRNA modification GTPase